MKTILKKVYYCDFCGKRYFQFPAMEQHEKGCTKNPDRVCGFCNIDGEDAPPMESLLNSLMEDVNCFLEKTGVKKIMYDDFFGDEGGLDWCFSGSKIPIKNLQVSSNDCPACILSAIRQIHNEIDTWIGYDFDFKKEVQIFWNDHQHDHDY